MEEEKRVTVGGGDCMKGRVVKCKMMGEGDGGVIEGRAGGEGNSL